MARKLYAYIAGECKTESVDTVSMQEVTLGGHTYLQFFKEKLMDAMINIKIQLIIKCRKEGVDCIIQDSEYRNLYVYFLSFNTGSVFDNYCAH